MARYTTLINFTEQASRPSTIGTSASPRRRNGSIDARIHVRRETIRIVKQLG
jgi:hypothetical protein